MGIPLLTSFISNYVITPNNGDDSNIKFMETNRVIIHKIKKKDGKLKI